MARELAQEDAGLRRTPEDVGLGLTSEDAGLRLTPEAAGFRLTPEAAGLRLTSRTDRGGYVVAALGGELGGASAAALRDQLFGLLRAASHVIVDLSEVDQADASGLAVLIGSGRRARLLGGSLRLAAPSPEVARVLSATGLNQHLPVFPTVRAAITGQPGLAGPIFPSATVPAGGRLDACHLT